MQKIFRKISLIIGFIISFHLWATPKKRNEDFPETVKSENFNSEESKYNSLSSIYSLYEEMNLNNQVNFDGFSRAVKGFYKFNHNHKALLTYIDFSKPSTVKRFYIFDMEHKKILLSTYVAHGKNSGEVYATSFSNKEGSNKSSLGFFQTAETYIGHNGYSLILDGLEPGINDNARQRSIVIHGADYANPEIIKSQGRLGRSFGCPALPRYLSKEVIDLIKGGTILFIYAKDSYYLDKNTHLIS